MMFKTMLQKHIKIRLINSNVERATVGYFFETRCSPFRRIMSRTSENASLMRRMSAISVPFIPQPDSSAVVEASRCILYLLKPEQRQCVPIVTFRKNNYKAYAIIQANCKSMY